MSARRGKRDWVPTALALAVACSTALLVLPVWVHAVDVWSTNDTLHFAFLLVPTALWLVWRTRAKLGRAPAAGSPGALALVVAALGAYVLFERVSALSPAACAAGVLVWAEVCYVCGWRTGSLLMFPIGLVTFGLALEANLVAPLGFWLQEVTASGAEAISHLVGLPVVREGLVLQSDTFAFMVAEACSGMNSLLALLGLAGVWIYLTQGTVPGRAAVVASVLPLVMVANTVRVVLVMVMANQYGQEAAIGFFHSVSSLVLFTLALVGLFTVSRLAGCRTLGTV